MFLIMGNAGLMSATVSVDKIPSRSKGLKDNSDAMASLRLLVPTTGKFRSLEFRVLGFRVLSAFRLCGTVATDLGVDMSCRHGTCDSPVT